MPPHSPPLFINFPLALLQADPPDRHQLLQQGEQGSHHPVVGGRGALPGQLRHGAPVHLLEPGPNRGPRRPGEIQCLQPPAAVQKEHLLLVHLLLHLVGGGGHDDAVIGEFQVGRHLDLSDQLVVVAPDEVQDLVAVGGAAHGLDHAVPCHKLAQLEALLPDLGPGGLHLPVGRHPWQQLPILPWPGDHAGGEVEVAHEGDGGGRGRQVLQHLLQPDEGRLKLPQCGVRRSVTDRHHGVELVHMHHEQLTHPVGVAVEHVPDEVVSEQQADAAPLPPGPITSQQLVAREVD